MLQIAASSRRKFEIGDRVGIGWINSACGHCPACLSGNENLCADFKATGRDVHGGYAEYLAIAENFAFAIPDVFSDVQAAPLLCAGAIGYRSLASGQFSRWTASWDWPDLALPLIWF